MCSYSLLNDNPLECSYVCDVNNALAEFASEDTTCTTNDGESRGLRQYCEFTLNH